MTVWLSSARLKINRKPEKSLAFMKMQGSLFSAKLIAMSISVLVPVPGALSEENVLPDGYGYRA